MRLPWHRRPRAVPRREVAYMVESLIRAHSGADHTWEWAPIGYCWNPDVARQLARRLGPHGKVRPIVISDEEATAMTDRICGVKG